MRGRIRACCDCVRATPVRAADAESPADVCRGTVQVFIRAVETGVPLEAMTVMAIIFALNDAAYPQLAEGVFACAFASALDLQPLLTLAWPEEQRAARTPGGSPDAPRLNAGHAHGLYSLANPGVPCCACVSPSGCAGTCGRHQSRRRTLPVKQAHLQWIDGTVWPVWRQRDCASLLCLQVHVRHIRLGARGWLCVPRAAVMWCRVFVLEIRSTALFWPAYGGSRGVPMCRCEYFTKRRAGVGSQQDAPAACSARGRPRRVCAAGGGACCWEPAARHDV